MPPQRLPTPKPRKKPKRPGWKDTLFGAPDARTPLGRVVDGARGVERIGPVIHPNTTRTPLDVMQEHLDVVASCLTEAGVAFFYIRTFTHRRHRIGVRMSERARAYDAIADRFVGQGYYLRTGTVLEDPASDLLDRVTRERALTTSLWRLYRLYDTPGTNLSMGEEHGCEIEFWAEEGDLLVAAGRNAVTQVIGPAWAAPDTITVRGTAYPTLEAFSKVTSPEDVTFPIDIVYTWVDGGDPAWRERMLAALQEVDPAAFNKQAANEQRFTNHDELRYSMRSVAMYADFVRHIYLVTDDQVPPWLNVDHPKITVVDHKEIFGDAGALPTFNSHAIESRLHYIEGLADHYLYMNDDVFLGRVISADAFFTGAGHTRFFPSRHQLDLTERSVEDPPVMSAAKNGRALIRERFGRTVTQKLKHTPHPQSKQVMREMEAEFADRFAATASHRFRHPDDISSASSLYHHYAFMRGLAVPSEIKYNYIDLAGEGAEERIGMLLKGRDADVFCLNETEAFGPNPDQAGQLLDRFLEAYYPLKCEFER